MAGPNRNRNRTLHDPGDPAAALAHARTALAPDGAVLIAEPNA